MRILIEPYADSGHPHFGKLTVVTLMLPLRTCGNWHGKQETLFVVASEDYRQSPVTIDTFLTKKEFLALVQHMGNGNPLSHFLTVWRDDEGIARFARAQAHKRADTHASWAWDTITGKSKRKTSMGLYPKNNDNESTWGALDFDAHSGDNELAKSRSIRAFSLLLEYRDRYLLLSARGRLITFLFSHANPGRLLNGCVCSKTPAS
jgi:hypothetical protein